MIRSARLIVAAALAALALAAAPAAAKPIYLTVPRAFGTDEAPTLDLAFGSHGPVQLRVVKPTSLDAFLATARFEKKYSAGDLDRAIAETERQLDEMQKKAAANIDAYLRGELPEPAAGVGAGAVAAATTAG